MASCFLTFMYLLRTDLYILHKTFVNKFINLMIWICSTTFVTVYLLPSFGLTQHFVHIVLTSLITSAGLFELSPSVTKLIADLEGPNVTSYYLTLPVPSWMIWIKNIIFYTLNCAIITLLVLPVTYIIAYNSVHFPQFSTPKFIIMVIAICLFYATSTLWIASFTRNIEHVDDVWMRFIYPAWYFAGYQFTWYVLLNTNKIAAYAILVNPMLYLMEGMRNAMIGPEKILSFPLCVIMTIIFTLLAGLHGVYRLKKRLDFC